MNKNGWGLRAELAFVILFLICIIISTIGLYRMGLIGSNNSVFKESTNNINFDYDSLERRLVNAASEYYKDNYRSNDDTIVVTTNTLKRSGYLDPLYDAKGKECKGYAMILHNSNIVSYIKCSMYKTTGYSDNYE